MQHLPDPVIPARSNPPTFCQYIRIIPFRTIDRYRLLDRVYFSFNPSFVSPAPRPVISAGSSLPEVRKPQHCWSSYFNSHLSVAMISYIRLPFPSPDNPVKIACNACILVIAGPLVICSSICRFISWDFCIRCHTDIDGKDVYPAFLHMIAALVLHVRKFSATIAVTSCLSALHLLLSAHITISAFGSDSRLYRRSVPQSA